MKLFFFKVVDIAKKENVIHFISEITRVKYCDFVTKACKTMDMLFRFLPKPIAITVSTGPDF